MFSIISSNDTHHPTSFFLSLALSSNLKHIAMTHTTTKTKHIDDLHFEHELWASEAKFYTDELKIYQKRLDEIASKNTSEDVRKQVEHFQNKFIIQKEQLDILNHEVTVHE